MSSLPKPLRIFLIEDSEDDVFFFRWTLKKCGVPFELECAADGGAALKRLRKSLAGEGAGLPPPDLIFLDLKIPTFSGFEVLAWIRQQEFNPPLRIAVLSGSEHANDIERAKDLGAMQYFVKPLSLAQLQSIIADLQKKPGEAVAPALPTSAATTLAR